MSKTIEVIENGTVKFRNDDAFAANGKITINFSIDGEKETLSLFVDNIIHMSVPFERLGAAIETARAEHRKDLS